MTFLSHICVALLTAVPGVSFHIPLELGYLSRGCLGHDDLFRGRKVALNQINVTFTCEQISWAHHSRQSKGAVANRNFSSPDPQPAFPPASFSFLPSLPSSFSSFSSSPSFSKRSNGNKAEESCRYSGNQRKTAQSPMQGCRALHLHVVSSKVQSPSLGGRRDRKGQREHVLSTH